MSTPVRTLVVWCPDWPVVAAGHRQDEVVAVVFANRVVACSTGARDEGIRRGLRRREAQSRYPELVVLTADDDRDARRFEPVVAAVEALAPAVEIIRPGLLAIPTRGPSRYFGGDDALAARATALADGALDGLAHCSVGVADGPFAAITAARSGAGRCTVVPPGTSPAFLAPLPIGTLEQPELVELLKRLGLRTLGDLAALPAADVLGRFGPDGSRAHRLASGLDDRTPLPRPPDPDLTVTMELDPPVERVETAAFIARTLAGELTERLGSRGLACTRVGIEAETEHGEVSTRLWRAEAALGEAAIADRVRWQLDGWLNSPAARPTGGISLLRLVPDQVVADDGRQLGFWGGTAAADERAARGVARLQGLLGPEAVCVPQRGGGRGPGEQVGLIPAHGVHLGRLATTDDVRPWPGRLPAPSPALVHAAPPRVTVLDATGAEVGVTGRGTMTATPVVVALAGGQERAVAAWAGPWPVDERWWDPAAARRRARLQVVLNDGVAHLLSLEHGRWTVEATYD